jgi:hypothetical protein
MVAVKREASSRAAAASRHRFYLGAGTHTTCTVTENHRRCARSVLVPVRPGLMNRVVLSGVCGDAS